MNRYPRRYWALATAAAALAGAVDAAGFLQTQGFFVSFMSGNSTRMAAALALGSPLAGRAGALILAFLLGVVAASLLPGRATRSRKTITFACVAVLLGTAALLDMLGQAWWAILLLSAAMGAENAVFQRNGEVSIGVTYMTGTLVKLGQRLATAVMGGDRWGWVPYLMLWTGLISGAVTGAVLFLRLGPMMFWGTAVFAALLALVAARLSRSDT